MRSKTFIAIEGIDGTGKSSVLHALQHWEELFNGKEPPILCKVPSYQPVTHQIRDFLMSEERQHMRPNVIDLLYLAAQIQEDQAVARPALERGCTVIADRWFLSQLAYSVVRPVDDLVLDLYIALHKKLGPHPDITIILTCDPWIALERARNRIERTSEKSRQTYKEWGNNPLMSEKIQEAYFKSLENPEIKEMMGGERIFRIDTTYLDKTEVIEKVKYICQVYLK